MGSISFASGAHDDDQYFESIAEQASKFALRKAARRKIDSFLDAAYPFNVEYWKWRRERGAGCKEVFISVLEYMIRRH
jgi:hypothetical protein